MADYYQTLGVTKSATADEIKSAYRKLARRYHPDVNKEPGAQKKFTEVQQAYDVLSDDQKRKLYDQFGSAAFESGGPGTAAGQQRPGPQPGASPHYSWSNVGGPGGGPGFGVDFDVDDASSIFESIFGRSGMGGGGGPRPGGRSRTRTRATTPDDFDEAEPTEVRQEITVDFMTAAKGGTQKLRITEDGKPRTIEVTIPPGTEENSQLRIRKAVGGRDLILRIHVAPHELFRRGEGETTGKGLDLSLDLPLNIAEATLGATVAVPTLTSPVEISVPPGTPSGRKIRLRGKGIHDPQGRQGDLYAVVKIIPPKGDTLPEPQKEELRRIAAHTPPARTGPYWPTSA